MTGLTVAYAVASGRPAGPAALPGGARPVRPLANLHGGFFAGLLLIGVVLAGLAVERRRGGEGAIEGRRLALLAATGALAAATVLVATPSQSATSRQS